MKDGAGISNPLMAFADGIFLDLSRAFNTIAENFIESKLHNLGFWSIFQVASFQIGKYVLFTILTLPNSNRKLEFLKIQSWNL